MLIVPDFKRQGVFLCRTNISNSPDIEVPLAQKLNQLVKKIGRFNYIAIFNVDNIITVSQKKLHNSD